MRITWRLILALAATAAALAGFSGYFEIRREKTRWVEDLDRRAQLLAASFQDLVLPFLEKPSADGLGELVEKAGRREKKTGLAVYDQQGNPMAVPQRWAPVLERAPRAVLEAISKGEEESRLETLGTLHSHVYALPIVGETAPRAVVAVIQDVSAGFLRARRIWGETFLRVMIQTILVAAVILVIVRWGFVGPVSRMADWMKQLRTGETSVRPPLPKTAVFAPLTKEATTFARELALAQRSAEEEARLRQASESLWTAERLKEHIRSKLKDRPLFVISNREPYLHRRLGRKVEWMVPAGGVVSALEPVLRASRGSWIAHGSGDADWETVDAKGRVRVPPDSPQYTLRRVALTKEEESGYYYGFANEGLWPLCHIAHTRPVFRADDWRQYQAANRKFARAAVEEMEGVEEPCVLVQDYHFALLSRYLKEARPDARIALFWHIPWPNPEAFGICPWQTDVLEGMLGADLVGFHIQSHCNNFLETVDRALESNIDWERFAVTKGGQMTLVRPFPISVDFPQAESPGPPLEPDRAGLLKGIGVRAEFLAVGVERMDYTKGILERFRAVERFLEKYPSYQGRFVLVQIGSPSRTAIKRYLDFLAEVEAEAERINAKFKPREYRPIVFLKKHHSHAEILPYFRSADVFLVTSLHDGMNLVSKEFVAAREDRGGVLILSRFTGASRELRDALLVNPYDIEQMADAIRLGLEMDSGEKTARMDRLRQTVRENNIYRWAGNLIEELTRIRPPAAVETQGT
jgi:trehalose 6-phosphate synthase